MSATLDSQAVFLGRCAQLELTQAEIDALSAARINTYSKFAWSCAYQPYSGDETTFLAMLATVMGAAPTLERTSIFRRLFCESHSLSIQEMRSKVERTEDTSPQKLQAPERSARYNDQRLRLAGMDLSGPLECSNNLIDCVMQQFDENSLKWLALETLTSREQELAGHKKDPSLVEYVSKIQQG